MPVSEIHHVAMTVSDLERSSEFYEKGLGYRRTLSARVDGPSLATSLGLPEGTAGRIQYLQGPTQLGQLELIQWDGEPGHQPRTGHRELGTFLLSFQVPVEEIEELHDRLASMGADCIGRPVRTLLQQYGYIHAFAARDPDGNLLEFVSLPTREEILAYRAANPPSGDVKAPAS